MLLTSIQQNTAFQIVPLHHSMNAPGISSDQKAALKKLLARGEVMVQNHVCGVGGAQGPMAASICLTPQTMAISGRFLLRGFAVPTPRGGVMCHRKFCRS